MFSKLIKFGQNDQKLWFAILTLSLREIRSVVECPREPAYLYLGRSMLISVMLIKKRVFLSLFYHEISKSYLLLTRAALWCNLKLQVSSSGEAQRSVSQLPPLRRRASAQLASIPKRGLVCRSEPCPSAIHPIDYDSSPSPLGTSFVTSLSIR